MKSTHEIRHAYDTVAENYAEVFYREFEQKPFDRKMLDWLVEKTAGLGPICDMGCGPGQVAAHVSSRGAQAVGIDLSDEMVRVARVLNPGCEFAQGDMRAPNVEDNAYGAVAAFYSIIHIPRTDVRKAFGEFFRVLKPGGQLLLCCHIGAEDVSVENFLDKPVRYEAHFYQREEIRAWLSEAGFALDEVMERDPYETEHATRRLYVFAHKAC
jgi:ubiquinone/menaquinone biosynthesis C-methylase UbiE